MPDDCGQIRDKFVHNWLKFGQWRSAEFISPFGLGFFRKKNSAKSLNYTVKLSVYKNKDSRQIVSSLPLTSSWWVRSTNKLCTVHSLSSALSVNLGNIEFEKFGNTEKQTMGQWQRSRYAIHCATSPLPSANSLYYTKTGLKAWIESIPYLFLQLKTTVVRSVEVLKTCCKRDLPL